MSTFSFQGNVKQLNYKIMHKDKNGNEIKIGSKVRWYDPEEECRDLSRIYEVYDIDEENTEDDAIIDIFDDYSEVQVFADELEVAG